MNKGIQNQELQQNYDSLSDEDLLRLMAKEEYDAFNAFSARYLQPLNRLVYRLGFRESECEDMLQDILVHIWQKAGQWSPQDKISARSWIYRVATNLCIDMQRKNKRQPVHAAQDFDVTPTQATDKTDLQVQITERREHIEEALDLLPERNRTALVLVYYQEMSNKEAADTMGVSVKAIEALLVRSRKMLKKNLKGQEALL